MITSTSNSIIKLAKSLREKKVRQESGLFYIEGLRIVTEACQQKAIIETIIYSPELLISAWGLQLITDQKELGTHILECDEKVFRSLSSKEGPQGIAALVRQNSVPISDLVVRDNDIFIALDSVQDPGNLGTILRTSDAVGAKGLILLDHCTDPFDPTATRASMGAIFDQLLIKTDLKSFIEWKTENNIAIIGTSDKAERDYHGFSYPSTMILLMGSEKQGLQEAHYELCDNVISIPMLGRSDSLNLAVATSLVLYEIINQQRDRNLSNSGKGQKNQ